MTTVERYIIELENGEFGFFNQISSSDIQIIGLSESDAMIFTKEKAEKIVAEINGTSQCNYYGDCVKAKGIRKVTLILED